MPAHYRFHYTVRPSNNRAEMFPIDMLRYDVCWPRTEQDSVAISSSLFGRHIEVPTPNHKDGFRHIHVIGLNPPTDERWLSFGWTISSAIEKQNIGG